MPDNALFQPGATIGEQGGMLNDLDRMNQLALGMMYVPRNMSSPVGAGAGPVTPQPSRAVAVVRPQPQQAASEVIGRGDLWKLPLDQIESMLTEKTASDRSNLETALGGPEAANEFNRLDRLQNSSNPSVADKAAQQFNARFGQLTPEQERLIYGYGETGPQVDDLKMMQDAHTARTDDPLDAAYEAAGAMRGIPLKDMMAVPNGNATPAAQAAFVRLKNAHEDMSNAGVPSDQVGPTIGQALIQRGGWTPDQAYEFVNSVLPAP